MPATGFRWMIVRGPNHRFSNSSFRVFMTKDRVTYFSNYDGSIGLYRPRFVEVLDAPVLACGSLGDALELYHVKQFVDNSLLKPTFTDTDWEGYRKKAKTIPAKIARFITATPSNALVREYLDLDTSFWQSFWDVLEGYGQEAKLEDEDMTAVLERSLYSLGCALRCKKIVRANNDYLRGYMMAHPESAEILLTQFVEQHDDGFRPYYFPEGLDVDSLLSGYIGSQDPNTNYLRMILNARDYELKVSPPLKIQAKKRIQEQHLKKESTLVYLSEKYGVSFSDKYDEVKAFVEEDGTRIWRYDSKFFLNTADVQLVPCLGVVFDYLDADRRISLVNKSSESNVFERVLMKAKSEYAPNSIFHKKAGIAIAQLAGLNSVLKADDRSLERAVESYYNEYLKVAYGLPFSDLNLLKVGDWREKVKVMLPLFDSIVKQYDLFVEHRKVTPDLMKYYPGIPVTDARSLVPMKYCQMASGIDELDTINYLLFSDQSSLAFVDPYMDKQYETFFELMRKEVVHYDSYMDYQRRRIDVLIKQGYVSVADNGTLFFPDKSKIEALFSLNHYGACSFWRRPPEQRVFLQELLKKGWVTEDKHLLCEPERFYFSYYLNDRQFSDAEGLRNRFLHGESDDVTANNYYVLLLLLILLLLKLDDDLSQYVVIASAAKS